MPRWRSVPHLFLSACALLCIAAADPPAPADEAPPALTIAASVDKTQVTVGEQLTLTITLSGDLTGVEFQEYTMPPALTVAAQSRSQHVRLVSGRTERSISFIYLLVPRQAGTFQLGPFHVTQGAADHATDPLEITVIRSPLPPASGQPVRRLTI